MTIADIIAEQGRVLADARYRQGQRRGQLVTSLAQIPGQIVADRREAQAAAARRAQEIAQGIRQQRADERLEAQETRAQAGFDAERDKERQQRLASEAQKIAAAGYVQVPQWIQDATRRGLFTPEEGENLLAQAQQPEGAKRIVDFIAPLADPKAAPNLIQRDPTRDLVDPTTGRVVTPGIPAPPEAPKLTFAAPQPVMVGGRRVLARAGSDGALYDMRGQRIADAQPDMPPSTAQGPQPGWQWVDRGGEAVHTNQPMPGDKPLRAPPSGAAMPAAMAATVAASQTSMAALDQLEAMFKDEMVGPWAGRYNTAERGANAMLGAVLPDAPEGFEDFAAETATLKNQVIQALTGAAVGVQEQGRIMKQIPDVTDTPSNWRAKAKATRRNLNELMANQVRMGTGAGIQPGTTVPFPNRGGETPEQRAKRLYDELTQDR